MNDGPKRRPPDNVYRFRRLKWGAPRRLRGMPQAPGGIPAETPRARHSISVDTALIVGTLIAGAVGLGTLLQLW